MNKQDTLRRLLTYLDPVKFLLIMAAILTIVSNVLLLYAPKLIGTAIDAIHIDDLFDMNIILRYCAILVVLYVASAIMTYILQLILIEASKRITYQLRHEVFHHLEQLPIRYFDQNQTGNIISRISYDIDTINTSLSSDILQFVTGTITVIGSFYLMITISPILSLITIVTIPIAFFMVKHRMKKVKPLFRRRTRKLGELNGYTEEMLSGNKTIKAYGQEDNIVASYEQQNAATSQAYYYADYEGSIMGPTVNFINNISLSMISMFGALLFLSGGITIGAISSFVMYSRKFSGPINETANIITEIQSAVSAAERIFKLLDEPIETADLPNAIKLDDDQDINVKFQDVCFGYDLDKEILHHVSFIAQSKQTIAIVGPTGAGKTTIINLLMRFYDANSGQILINDIPIDHYTRKSLRQAFSMVLQDTWLFAGSIYDNVAYANPNASKEEVIAVCKKAFIHHFIMSLPQGYDTIITDDGINISKGQKQLLTIARAMLSPSKILILDEATSNVDSQTEILIQNAMLELMKDKTCFVIAHRLSTIKNADDILVLKDGRIIENGTHQQLLMQKGFYHRLFNSQFS